MYVKLFSNIPGIETYIPSMAIFLQVGHPTIPSSLFLYQELFLPHACTLGACTKL
jgi:hypothetical protein